MARKPKILTLVLVCMLFLFSYGACIWGAEPEQLNQDIDRAILWMEQNLNLNYDDWGINLAADIRNLSEAAAYLKEKRPDMELVNKTTEWLSQQETLNNDFAARILPFIQDPQEYIEVRESLIMCQQPDGGWGLTGDFESEILDTLLVVNALLKDTQPDTEPVIRGVSFLVQNQNSDGSWSYVKGQPGSIFLSAKCILLLNDFMIKTNLSSEELNTCMRKAGEYLLSQQKPDQTWGTNEDELPATLVAYRAVLNTIGIESVAGLEDTLLDLQDPEGSWHNNAYTTLLAIQALDDKPVQTNVNIADIKLYKNEGEGQVESQSFDPYQNVIIEPVAQYDSTLAELQIMIKHPGSNVESACYEGQYCWNTAFNPPGNYKVIAVIKDKQSGRILAGKEKEFTIEPVFAIKDIVLSAYPASTRVGQEVQTTINISLLNQSNQDGEVLLETTVTSSDSIALLSTSNTYPCIAKDEIISLPPVEFAPDVADEKEYTIKARVTFNNNQTLEKSILFKVLPPPAPTRIDATQSLSKDFLYPGNDNVTATFTLSGQGTPEMPQRKPIDLVLILDNSGSMYGNPSLKSREAAKNIVNLIQPQDRAGVVAFHSSAWICQGLTNDTALLKSKISSIQSANGGTSIDRGISKAIELTNSQSQPDRTKVFILLSDGQSSANAAINQANAAAQKGIIIHTLGLGSGINESLLKTIAQTTNGTYHYSPTPEQLNQMMIDIGGEIFDTAGRDVTLTTTLLPGLMTIDVQQIQPAPQTINHNPDGSITITWYFNKIIMGQTISLPITFSGANLVSDTNIPLTTGTTLNYLDSNNNPINEELEALFITVNKYKMDTTINLDKNSYQPGENMAIDISASNLTDYNCTLTGSVAAVDADGVLAETIATENNISWNPKETKNFTYSWTCPNLISGPYQAIVRWQEGEKEISFASAPFQISSDGSLNIKVITDQAAYNANDTVKINTTVGNASNNSIYNRLKIVTEIEDSNNEVIWSTEQPLNELLPGASEQITDNWPVSQNPPGQYTVSATVYQEDNTLICSDNTLFTILPSESGGLGLTGRIEVENRRIYPVDDVGIHWQIKNTGNTVVNNLETRIRVVEPFSEEVIDTIPITVSLAVGESRDDTVTWTHPVLQPGNYLLVYDAVLPDGNTLTLSSSAIIVEKPFTVEINQIVKPRVLVWSLCPANVDLARTTLGEMQVYYRIVNNRFDFIHALQSGQYNTYIILDNLIPLLPCEDQLLADHIASGKGLVAASYFNGDNFKNLGVFGADFKAFNLPGLYTVNIPSGSAFNESTLKGLGITQILKTTTGIEEAKLKLLFHSFPAIVSNQYQQGKTILFAFDFRDINHNSAVQLLRNAIELACPREETTGNVIEIEIKINPGMNTSGKIENLLPAGSNILWAQPAASGNDSSVWEFETVPGQEQSIRFIIQIPEDIPEAILTTQSYFMVDGTWYRFDSTDTSLNLP